MIIELRLFAGLHKHVEDGRSGEPFSVTIEENASLTDLLRQMGIPEQEAFVTMVNGQASPHYTVLRDGDRVGIFPAVGGG